jgi:hypothetical protein
MDRTPHGLPGRRIAENRDARPEQPPTLDKAKNLLSNALKSSHPLNVATWFRVSRQTDLSGCVIAILSSRQGKRCDVILSSSFGVIAIDKDEVLTKKDIFSKFCPFPTPLLKGKTQLDNDFALFDFKISAFLVE